MASASALRFGVVGWKRKKDLSMVLAEVVQQPLCPFFDAARPKTEDDYRGFLDNVDVILWFAWMLVPVPWLQAGRVTHPHVQHIMVNIDDPFCWSVSEFRMKDRVRAFGRALVSSSAKLAEYAALGCKVRCAYPPIAAQFVPKAPAQPYMHDVCFLATNLYPASAYPGQLWDREAMVRALDADVGVAVGVYGPETLRDVAPRTYVGWCSFAHMATVFAASRIVVSTHVVNARAYLNRRCLEAMASGAVVLMDDILGARDLLGDAVVYLDTARPFMDQVHAILREFDGAGMCAVRARAPRRAASLASMDVFKQHVDAVL